MSNAPGTAVLAVAVCFGSAAACTRDEPPVPVVPRPASAEAIVTATGSTAGLQIDLEAGADDLVVLRSTSRLDTAAGRAHRRSEGAVGTEFDSADPPPLVDFGETWFVDGEVYERAPGETTARPVSGDLADFLFVDSRGVPVDDLTAALEQLLEGWPATTVSDAELVGDVPTHHLRFERPDGDTVDVWVDDRARILATVRRSERAAPIELRLRFTYLDAAPALPELPELAGS